MLIKNKTIVIKIIVRIILTSFGCLSLSKNNGKAMILITRKMINGARKPSKKLSYFQMKTPEIPRIMLNIRTPDINSNRLRFLSDGNSKIGKKYFEIR